MRWGLGVSHCLSLEDAVVLRHLFKSLQPHEMKLGLSVSPRLFSCFPVHHLHSHSWSEEVQLWQPMTWNLPLQVRIELILKYSCNVQLGVSIIHLTPLADYTALKQLFDCPALCHSRSLLCWEVAGLLPVPWHLTVSACCVCHFPKMLLFEIGAPPSPLLLRSEGVHVFPGISIHLAELISYK